MLNFYVIYITHKDIDNRFYYKLIYAQCLIYT